MIFSSGLLTLGFMLCFAPALIAVVLFIRFITERKMKKDNTEYKKLLKKAISELRDLHNEDPETAHGSADEIMLQFLEDIGCNDIVKEYWEVYKACGGFWYA